MHRILTIHILAPHCGDVAVSLPRCACVSLRNPTPSSSRTHTNIELDELMIFNEAIPMDDIVEAATGRQGTEMIADVYSDGLMHWYRLNENEGAEIFDEVEPELKGVIVDVLGDQVYRAESGVAP